MGEAHKAPDLVLVDLTTASPEERDHLASVAVGMYRGERCRFCTKAIVEDVDLAASVFSGYDPEWHGRISHKRCWDEASPELIAGLKAAQVSRSTEEKP